MFTRTEVPSKKVTRTSQPQKATLQHLLVERNVRLGN